MASGLREATAPATRRRAVPPSNLLGALGGAQIGTGGSAVAPDQLGGLNTLVQLELLKVLKKMQRGGQEDGDSDEDEAPGLGLRSSGGGTDALTKMRRQLRRQPDKVVAAYVAMMKDRLGVVDARQVWHPTDFSKKLLPRFGRYRGIWRVHWMLGEVLTALLQHKFDEATALTCQMQKILVQHVIDHGDWSTAMLMWPSADPLMGEEFGGGIDEMTAVYKYKKAVGELKSKYRSGAAGAEEDGETETKPWHAKGNKKDKGQGRGKGGGAQEQ